MGQVSIYRIAIIGLGYVGLPLAKLFCENGHTVYGIDVDAGKIEKLNKRQSYLSDFTRSDIKRLFTKESFHVGSSFDVIAHVDVIIICVPTPLDRESQPDLTYVLNAIKSSLPFIHSGQLVVLESSTYPGTTEEELQPLIESKGFEIGRHISLVYSPERINPGQQQFQLQDIPKLVGGVTPKCAEYARKVYRSIFSQVFVVSSPRVAEMAKLLENSQRFINISFMNNLVKLCDEMNIDLWEVIQAASTKPYGFTPYYPGPGIGGHCIPVDPLYLLWKAKKYNIALPLIDICHQVNEEMPEYIVQRIERSLQTHQQKPLDQSRVLIIGVTYKKNINDLRESAALKIIELLVHRGVIVNFYDPYVKELHIGEKDVKCMPLTAKNVKQHDCTLIITDHSNIPYELLVAYSSLVLDTRNVTEHLKDRANVILL